MIKMGCAYKNNIVLELLCIPDSGKTGGVGNLVGGLERQMQTPMTTKQLRRDGRRPVKKWS